MRALLHQLGERGEMICEDFPRPWIVGPFGDVWVAADVEFRDGKWRELRPEPRIVVTLGLKDKALGELIVNSVNAASAQPPAHRGPAI